MSNLEKIVVSDDYSLKELSIEDKEIVLDAAIRCADYFMLHDNKLPEMSDVERIFESLPPKKEYEDKWVFGLFKDDYLIGVIDVVKDYPVNSQWIIGLMIVDKTYRGNGLGATVHSALTNWAKTKGAESFRVGSIKKNLGGNRFWLAQGYEKIKESEISFTNLTHKTNVMVLEL
jgi:GNAT superfamily N-acetyltransferase